MPYPGSKKKRSQWNEEQKSDGWQEERKQEKESLGQTENFFSTHVRLITAVVTIAVLLALIGPWSVFKLMEWYDATHEEAVEVLIPIETLDRLVAKGPDLNWVDFDGYTYEVIAEKYAYICSYEVEGGRYCLWVTSAEYGSRVESVLLIDMQNGTQTELKKP